MGDMRECLRAVCYNKVQSACAMPVSKTVREVDEKRKNNEIYRHENETNPQFQKKGSRIQKERKYHYNDPRVTAR